MCVSGVHRRRRGRTNRRRRVTAQRVPKRPRLGAFPGQKVAFPNVQDDVALGCDVVHALHGCVVQFTKGARASEMWLVRTIQSRMTMVNVTEKFDGDHRCLGVLVCGVDQFQKTSHLQTLAATFDEAVDAKRRSVHVVFVSGNHDRIKVDVLDVTDRPVSFTRQSVQKSARNFRGSTPTGRHVAGLMDGTQSVRDKSSCTIYRRVVRRMHCFAAGELVVMIGPRASFAPEARNPRFSIVFPFSILGCRLFAVLALWAEVDVVIWMVLLGTRLAPKSSRNGLFLVLPYSTLRSCLPAISAFHPEVDGFVRVILLGARLAPQSLRNRTGRIFPLAIDWVMLFAVLAFLTKIDILVGVVLLGA